MAHTSLLTKLFLIVHKPAEIFKPSGESAKVVKSDVADIMEEEDRLEWDHFIDSKNYHFTP